MAANPYQYSDEEDEFFTEYKDTPHNTDEFEYAGHMFSETKPCTVCKAFHYLPGLKGLDPHMQDYISAILREFVKKFEMESKKYASTMFNAMFYIIIHRFDFQHGYNTQRNCVLPRAQAEKLMEVGKNVPLEVLAKISRAEFLLVSLTYQSNIIETFDYLSNHGASKTEEEDKEGNVIKASVSFFQEMNAAQFDMVAKQYKQLCENYNYPINETYLDQDVMELKPRNEFDRLYTLESIRTIVQDVVYKLFENIGDSGNN